MQYTGPPDSCLTLLWCIVWREQYLIHTKFKRMVGYYFFLGMLLCVKVKMTLKSFFWILQSHWSRPLLVKVVSDATAMQLVFLGGPALSLRQSQTSNKQIIQKLDFAQVLLDILRTINRFRVFLSRTAFVRRRRGWLTTLSVVLKRGDVSHRNSVLKELCSTVLLPWSEQRQLVSLHYKAINQVLNWGRNREKEQQIVKGNDIRIVKLLQSHLHFFAFVNFKCIF